MVQTGEAALKVEKQYAVDIQPSPAKNNSSFGALLQQLGKFVTAFK